MLKLVLKSVSNIKSRLGHKVKNEPLGPSGTELDRRSASQFRNLTETLISLALIHLLSATRKLPERLFAASLANERDPSHPKTERPANIASASKMLAIAT